MQPDLVKGTDYFTLKYQSVLVIQEIA